MRQIVHLDSAMITLIAMITFSKAEKKKTIYLENVQYNKLCIRDYLLLASRPSI